MKFGIVKEAFAGTLTVLLRFGPGKRDDQHSFGPQLKQQGDVLDCHPLLFEGRIQLGLSFT